MRSRLYSTLILGSALLCSLPLPAQVDAPSAALQQARELVQARKFDQAIPLLERLARENPALPGVARELGIAWYRKSDHVRAASHLQQALAEDPGDKEAIQLLGLSHFFLGRPAEAAPLLEQVRSWLPLANVDASYVLGVCYIQLKDYDKARTAFAEMFAVPPGSAAAHLLFARMLLRQGFDPVAEQHVLKAVQLDPELPRAHLLLGELYMFKSRIPEAIAAFEKELALNPADATALYKLADAYSRVNRFDEAQRLLQRSIWLDSTASGPFVLMGKVLLRKGEHELAAGMLERAVQMDPNNYIGHHLLGQAYRELGRAQDAERQFTLAQQLQSAQNPRPE